MEETKNDEVTTVTTENKNPFEKINEKIARLAAQKRKLKADLKKKEEKERKKKIFAIGELFEHLGLLEVEKEVAMGFLIEAKINLSSEVKVNELRVKGKEELENMENEKERKKSKGNEEED